MFLGKEDQLELRAMADTLYIVYDEIYKLTNDKSLSMELASTMILTLTSMEQE